MPIFDPHPSVNQDAASQLQIKNAIISYEEIINDARVLLKG
jgi:hypothetical protein